MLSNPYITSPQQLSILARIGTLANIGYVDERLAARTIALSIFKELSNGRASIVVSEDESVKTMIWESLSDLGIHHVAIECGASDKVLSNDIVSWREWLKVQHSDVGEQYQDSKYRFESLHKKVAAYYGQNLKNDTSSFDIDRVLEKYWMLPSDKNSLNHLLLELDIDGMAFDLPTYNAIMADLEVARLNFEPAFELINNKPYVCHQTDNFGSYEELSDLTFALFGFKESATNLHGQYVSLILEVGEEHRQQLYTQMYDVSQRIDNLSHQGSMLREKINKKNVSKPKTGLALWPKKDTDVANLKSDLANHCRELNDFFVANKCSNPELSVEVLIANKDGWVEDLKSRLESFQSSIPRRVTDYLKSTNKLNINHITLVSLESQLISFIDAINKAKIFSEPQELNTISLVKQYDFLNRLLVDIKSRSLQISEHLPYFQWILKVNEMGPHSIRVINALRSYDVSNWMEIINRWFYHQVLLKQSHQSRHIDTSHLHESAWLYGEMNQLQAQRICAALKLPDDLIKKSLKGKFSALYKAIFNNDQLKEQVLWKHLIEGVPDFVSLKYPVLILDSDDFGSMKKDVYSNIFYIGSRDIHPDSLQLFKSIHTYIDANDQGIIDTDLALSYGVSNEQSSLSYLPTSQRVAIARKLTSLMLAIDNQPKIYQLRRNGIIFFGKDFIARRLEKELYEYGIKQVMIDDSIEETLLATWLNQQALPIVIIENHLINAHRSDSYLWQLQIKEYIESHGATILDLHINKNWQTGITEVVDRVIKVIKDVNSSDSEAKNQLSIEF
jgi:hypothetical protein